ncbi:MAG: hypothetical protein ACETV1_05325 [Candidatus Bathyarchaeia archaeon]
MEIPLRPFEEEIIDRFKTFDITVGGGKSRPRKGIWIKQHLLDVGEDFIYSMWERWQSFTRIAHTREAEIESGTYGALRTYIYLLRKHGLLIPTKREQAKTTNPLFFRQYYQLNRRRLEDPLWRNPYKPYLSWQRWRQKGFPRPKKKPKPLYPPGIPPFPFLTAQELDRISAEAFRFLREKKYTITRKQLEEIIPDWGVEAVGYDTFRERVAYLIHEAVEVEEVSEVAMRLIDPRLAPEAVAMKAHQKAEKLQKEYLKAQKG